MSQQIVIGTDLHWCPGARRTNAVAERFVGTARRECLDRLLILGRRHLEAVLTEYLQHYDRNRPHRSVNQRPPHHSTHGPADVSDVEPTRLQRGDRLSGLLREYQLVA
jgi:putative transposase